VRSKGSAGRQDWRADSLARPHTTCTRAGLPKERSCRVCGRVCVHGVWCVCAVCVVCVFVWCVCVVCVWCVCVCGVCVYL